jgi:hypothetical protein
MIEQTDDKKDQTLTGNQKMWLFIILAMIFMAPNYANSYKDYKAKIHAIDVELAETKSINQILLDVLINLTNKSNEEDIFEDKNIGVKIPDRRAGIQI